MRDYKHCRMNPREVGIGKCSVENWNVDSLFVSSFTLVVRRKGNKDGKIFPFPFSSENSLD